MRIFSGHEYLGHQFTCGCKLQIVDLEEGRARLNVLRNVVESTREEFPCQFCRPDCLTVMGIARLPHWAVARFELPFRKW